MEIIELRHPFKAQQIPTEEVVLVLGFFDGVHRGHQAVIETGKKIAQEKQLKLAVMTFNQHPSIVFQKINPETMKYLTTVEQKAQHFEKLGVDYLYVVDFTSAFAKLAPQEFVDQYLVGLHAKVVVAGFDYTYGKRDIATMERLPLYAKDRFDIVSVEEQQADDEKISSTRIRELLEAGKLAEANQLLGYIYEVNGVVIHGDARGRTLGFPTANIQVEASSRLPKVGVYAVKIKVGNSWYEGMASIGYNVTFGADRGMTVEVYIFDFNQDIYGEAVTVAWYTYLRPEIKFNGKDELIAQLHTDEKMSRAYFSKGKLEQK